MSTSRDNYEEILLQKNREYEDLKSQFDEFIEASKEIELDLVGRNTELDRKKNIFEEKCSALQTKLDSLNIEGVKLANELEKQIKKVAQYEANKRILEQTNDDLSSKLRVLEATEDDLTHRLQSLQEDSVLLKNDILDLNEAHQESESRLKSELT